jgi:hypothetical protein
MDVLLQRLPDDIIIRIYTKILRKYRFHDGKLIRLINFEKYKFLEKFISRKIYYLTELKFHEHNCIEFELKYKMENCCELSDRKDLSIDDDMMYVYLTIKENTVRYDIQLFRLKKIEDGIKKKPSIYYRGNYLDYDWEVFSYFYEI